MPDYQPWGADEKRRLEITARQCATHSQYHTTDKLARENCPGCALKYTQKHAPNYAGWVRIYIELGWEVPRWHYERELEYAREENPAYHNAIMRDIATFGIRLKD